MPSITSDKFGSAAAAVAAVRAMLFQAGIADASRDARLLVAHALGIDTTRLLAVPDAPLDESQRARLKCHAQRRSRREPVSRIVGSRGFYGRDFEISPATLDPRPDSETLIEAVLETIGRDDSDRRAARRILDVGTGSGCLLVTLLAELPGAKGVGTDVSDEALLIAERNARRHGVGDRATWKLSRSLDGQLEPFDVLVANPPYIPTGEIDQLDPEVRNYDPRLALDGGSDGLDIFREIVVGLERAIPDGWAFFEVGLGQAAAVAELLSEADGKGVGRARVFRDLNGIARCVAWKARG